MTYDKVNKKSFNLKINKQGKIKDLNKMTKEKISLLGKK